MLHLRAEGTTGSNALCVFAVLGVLARNSTFEIAFRRKDAKDRKDAKKMVSLVNVPFRQLN